MKISYLILTVVLVISALLQMIWGIWIIVDVKTVSEIFLGRSLNIQESKEILITFSMLGKSFLMLSAYSIVTIIFVLRKKVEGILLSLIGGISISIIAISSYFETESIYVLFTDLLRGILIITFALLIVYINIKRRK